MNHHSGEVIDFLSRPIVRFSIVIIFVDDDNEEI